MSDQSGRPEVLGEYLRGLLQRLDRYGLPSREYAALRSRGEELARLLPALETEPAVRACTAYVREVFAAMDAGYQAALAPTRTGVVW